MYVKKISRDKQKLGNILECEIIKQVNDLKEGRGKGIDYFYVKIDGNNYMINVNVAQTNCDSLYEVV